MLEEIRSFSWDEIIMLFILFPCQFLIATTTISLFFFAISNYSLVLKFFYFLFIHILQNSKHKNKNKKILGNPLWIM